MSDQATTAQIIDELLATGEPVDSGRFTLDAIAAASKMALFRYTDRSAYLLPIVEAVHGLGAREVAVSRLGPDLLIRAEGVALPDPAAELAALYSHAVGESPDPSSRALGRLGVGLDMALGWDAIGRVCMSYSGEHDRIIAEFTPSRAPRLARSEPGARDELQILFDRPGTSSPSSSLRPSRASAAELAHLREAVHFSRRPVTLDREPISGHERGGAWSRRGKSEGFSYAVHLAGDDEPNVVELWTAGIRVDTLDMPGEGMLAEVHLDAPRRDLSQLRIVRDATIDVVRDELAHAHAELVRERSERRRENAEVEAAAASRGATMPPVFTGAVYYTLGLIAGTIGVSMLASGRLAGLLALIFFVSHGCIAGAADLSRALETKQGKREHTPTRVMLVLLACALALVFGLAMT